MPTEFESNSSTSRQDSLSGNSHSVGTIESTDFIINEDKPIDIPSKIDDSEPIVRIIFNPYHVDKAKKKVKSAAFKPPPNIDQVSVIRHQYQDADFCRTQGKNMSTDDKTYLGLAVLTCLQIKEAGSDIVDSPKQFRGHADIVHGYIPQRGVPTPPEIEMKLQALAKAVNYHPDPDLAASHWTGPTPLPTKPNQKV